MKHLLMRYRVLLVVIVVLMFAIAGVILFASNSRAQGSATLVGSWQAETTFISGTNQGRRQAMRITFTSDGHLTATIEGLPDPARGVWYNHAHTFTYNFHESVVLNGQTVTVIVTHLLTYLAPSSFTSEGIGYGYTSALPYAGENQTITNAQRVL